MIKVALLNPIKNSFNVIDIDENSLDDLYYNLECEYIDIVVRNVGGRQFDIVCDDEGLLKENPAVSAVDSKYNRMLVGNLIFAHHDSNGNLTGISLEEVEHLEENLSWCLIQVGAISRVVLIMNNVEYK